MNAFEILKFTKKYFPLVRKEGIEFDDYVNSILVEYKKLVNESTDLFDCKECGESKYAQLGRDKFLIEFNAIIESLSASINLYLSGFPSQAFGKLNEGMSKILYEDKSIEYFNGAVMIGNGSIKFYRIRESETKYPLTRQELFHVPFSQRRKIHTKRYSIPGLPSLYLSDSIYVAWEELRRPKFNNIHVSRLELAENFSYLDLTTGVYCRKNIQSYLSIPIMIKHWRQFSSFH